MSQRVYPFTNGNGNVASNLHSAESENSESSEHLYDSDSESSVEHKSNRNGAAVEVDIVPTRASSLISGCLERILRLIPPRQQANRNGVLNYMPVKKSSEEYKMNHDKLGKAVIFSFSKWNKQKKRLPLLRPLPSHFFRKKFPQPIRLDKSSKDQIFNDEQKVTEVLANIGFEVERYHNLKSYEFHKTLQSLQKEDHRNADCLLIIILTYGGDNTLFLSDRVQFPVHCLWTEYFEADKCLTLAAKPKIFLVQALSESDDDTDQSLGDDSDGEAHRGINNRSYVDLDSGNFSYTIPNAADIIVAFTYPTVSALKHKSGLIYNFAQVLEKHAFELEINKIFTLTSHLMQSDDAQHLVILSTLIRQLKFPRKNNFQVTTIIDETIQHHSNILHYYNTDTPRRGKAVVFNFYKFQKGEVNHSPREGSKKDLMDLQKLFQELNFNVVTHEDLPNQQFLKELDKIKNEDHSESECLVVVVMTHGEQNRLIMADHAQFPIHFVWKDFEDHMCPSLKGKPKIFIIQACRGNEFDHGTRVKNIPEVSSSSNINSFIDSTSLSCVKPKSPDIFVAYSTPFGKFSLRDRQEGSWFIQEVVKVFSKHYSSLDIHDLFTTVARNVAINYTTAPGGKSVPPDKKQVPSSTSTLTKTYKFSDRASVEIVNQ